MADSSTSQPPMASTSSTSVEKLTRNQPSMDRPNAPSIEATSVSSSWLRTMVLIFCSLPLMSGMNMSRAKVTVVMSERVKSICTSIITSLRPLTSSEP